MLSQKDLDAYITRQGPYVYHKTYGDDIAEIARKGLIPWNELEFKEEWGGEDFRSRYADSRATPREDHVYVGSSAYVRRYHGIRIRVDLRRIDLQNIDSDEDHFDASVPFDRAPVLGFEKLEDPPRLWGSSEDFIDEICERCQGEEGHKDCPECGGEGYYPDQGTSSEETLGDWAERQSDIIDEPEFVKYSLLHGSVAIRGRIFPEALSIDFRQVISHEKRLLVAAFSKVEITINPFTVINDEGKKILVHLDKFGLDESGNDYFHTHDHTVRLRAEDARARAIIELFNSGYFRRPELLDVNTPVTLETGRSLAVESTPAISSP